MMSLTDLLKRYIQPAVIAAAWMYESALLSLYGQFTAAAVDQKQ